MLAAAAAAQECLAILAAAAQECLAILAAAAQECLAILAAAAVQECLLSRINSFLLVQVILMESQHATRRVRLHFAF